jgi:WD40-like Beta Propeller Repeat
MRRGRCPRCNPLVRKDVWRSVDAIARQPPAEGPVRERRWARPNWRRGWAAAAGIAIAACAAAGLAPAPAGAAGLIAAYDRYEPARGFDLGLVNVSTGQRPSLPTGVNTTDDELHPALSPDGRYLVFMRVKLVPKLNGDIVPPAERSLLRLDRQTGQIVVLQAPGAGPTFTPKGSATTLAWGLRPVPLASGFSEIARHASFSSGALGPVSVDPGSAPAAPGQILDTTHAAVVPQIDLNPNTGARGDRRYVALAYADASTGALQKGLAQLSTFRPEPGGIVSTGKVEFGSPGAPASHPVVRNDAYVALDLTKEENADIQTLSFPGETALSPAPAPITSAAPERMPAWSPDGVQLGFVRTTAGRRLLAVFDATPGIQTILNAPVDLGADAPTPQTRSFQSTWGGLSLAASSAADVPAVTCTGRCLSALTSSNLALANVSLQPLLSSTAKGQSVGIFVVRVAGARKLLGRAAPRIRVVGRVPLGATVKGVNRFRWNGKVNGRRLAPGTYLLTYRSLKRGRILSTSGSIRLTVTAAGKIVNVRRQAVSA